MKIFSAILKNSKNFKLLCSVLKDLSIDITIVLKHDSIIISTMDKNVLISIELQSISFSYFHNLQQRIQININTINLYKIISRIQKKANRIIYRRRSFY